MDAKEALQIERDKRKAVARKRICWFLAILNVVLVIYIAIQIIILIQH